jgi:hypothetical protein
MGLLYLYLLHEVLRALTTMPCPILLSTRNFGQKLKKKLKINLIFSNVFPKIALFFRKCGKIMKEPDRSQIKTKNGGCALHAG